VKVSEVAAYLRPSFHRLEMVRKGDLPAFRIGSDLSLQIEVIDRLALGTWDKRPLAIRRAR